MHNRLTDVIHRLATPPLLGAIAWALVLLPIQGAHAYNIQGRWTTTRTDGGGIARGDAITLLWSVVPDGESWSRGGPSDLVDYLDVGWNVAQADRTPDLTNRPWWQWLDRVYSQYTRVSGLTLEYVPEQTPGGIDSGQFGDIRIGGVPFTWENDKGGVLADNAFPNNGDMRIDTFRGDNGVPSFWHTNPAAFRNLISHESGHGVGLGHSNITGANAVMETPLESNFWGLQFDDVYAFNRNYGDPLEKGAGNDSPDAAVDLGVLQFDFGLSMGLDAGDSVVQELDGDWLGVDGLSDEDWFRFEVASKGSVSVGVIPVGPTYSTEEQGPDTDFSARSDLYFEIYGQGRNEVERLALVDFADAGSAEELVTFPLGAAGEYFVRVAGETDLNQFYQLDLLYSAVTGVPGDVNQDGVLNSLDIDALVDGWLSDTSALDSVGRVLLGDLDLSGRTDLTDATILQQALRDAGNAVNLAALLSVPEPATVWIAISAMAGAAHRRPRRDRLIASRSISSRTTETPS